MSLQSSIIRTLLNSPRSLADLQPVAQVSLPTLRKAVQELTDSRWIRVVGQSEANGGRPPMLFGLDNSYYIIIGVHLQLPGMRLVASDLTGHILDSAEQISNHVPTPDEALQRMIAYCEHIHLRFPQRSVLGIGIASPGFTEPATGEILSIGRVPGWHNFPICQRLQAALNVPVSIANDVDSMAFAEFRHTGTSFERNLAYVGFDEGVKVSLFLNGQLYKGSVGNAGLIVTDLLHIGAVDGLPDRSQILTIHGVNNLFDARLRALPVVDREPYRHIEATTKLRRRFERILQGAADGLPVCQQVVEPLNTALATALANIFYIIQPDITVIGGMLTAMPPAIYADLETAIRQYLPPLFAHRSIIQQATLSSPDRAALGAAYHFLQNHLSGSASLG